MTRSIRAAAAGFIAARGALESGGAPGAATTTNGRFTATPRLSAMTRVTVGFADISVLCRIPAASR
jgi:hypothetical protein